MEEQADRAHGAVLRTRTLARLAREEVEQATRAANQATEAANQATESAIRQGFDVGGLSDNERGYEDELMQNAGSVSNQDSEQTSVQPTQQAAEGTATNPIIIDEDAGAGARPHKRTRTTKETTEGTTEGATETDARPHKRTRTTKETTEETTEGTTETVASSSVQQNSNNSQGAPTQTTSAISDNNVHPSNTHNSISTQQPVSNVLNPVPSEGGGLKFADQCQTISYILNYICNNKYIIDYVVNGEFTM